MRFKSRILPWLVLVVGLIGLGSAWVKRYDIYDWWRLNGYNPSARVVELADDTSMSARGRKLFYVNRPELNGKADFNKHCNFHLDSIVLGCFVSGKGIFIYDVQDERLAGIHQVTAAHEMLHAVYERLSPGEKKRVDDLTASVFDNLQDERIRTTIESYKKRDPRVVPNELHSILATEVSELTPALEDYYGQYFSDRSKVVAFSKSYEAEFQKRKQKITELEERITALRADIVLSEQSLEEMSRSLDSEKQEMDQLRASGRIEEYNQRVNPYNNQIERYRAEVRRHNNLVNQHNALVKEHNDIAFEVSELVEAIDARPDTVPN